MFIRVPSFPRTLFGLALVLAATGCTDMFGPEPTPEPTGSELEPQFREHCYDPGNNHCYEEPPPWWEDPCPNCDGVYITDVTPYACTHQMSDLDEDGFERYCEYRIASQFRPLLATNIYDKDLSRRPHWAVRPLEADGSSVKVIYLFSYAIDGGNDFNCSGQLGVVPKVPDDLCSMHWGDSEFVWFNIRYNYRSDHWQLDYAFLSAHWNSPADASASGGASMLSYPVRDGWYPRIWVARDKHANYVSRGACNAGGDTSFTVNFFGYEFEVDINNSDTCEQNVDDVRLYVSRYRNVGSSNQHLIDEVAFTWYPYHLEPRHEFYWNSAYDFCGWYVSDTSGRGDCAGTYGQILTTFGF